MTSLSNHFSLMTPLLVRRKNLRFMIFQKFKFIKNSKVMLHGWPLVTSSDQRSNHELTWFQITFQNEKMNCTWSFWFLNVLCSMFWNTLAPADSRNKRFESEFAGFLFTSGWHWVTSGYLQLCFLVYQFVIFASFPSSAINQITSTGWNY